jgi:four helix bundle protein
MIGGKIIMATFKSFEEIDAWKKSRLLLKSIYLISNSGPFSKDFRFKDHIRKTGESIMSNIAEGSDRDGNPEFIYFLNISKGSTAELKSQLYVALDQEYIDENNFKQLYDSAAEIGRMLGGLIKYLIKSKIKGIRFKR